MVTKKEIVESIRENRYEINMLGVKRIGVFGSFARSTQRQRSDIDVLVEFRQGRKAFDNYMELKFFLEDLFRRKVDLVIKDALKPRIRQSVLREVIYA